MTGAHESGQPDLILLMANLLVSAVPAKHEDFCRRPHGKNNRCTCHAESLEALRTAVEARMGSQACYKPGDATEACDGCSGDGIRPYATNGLLIAPPAGFVIIERCGYCNKYESDLDAAKAWGRNAHWQGSESGNSRQAIALQRPSWCGTCEGLGSLPEDGWPMQVKCETCNGVGYILGD